MLGNDVVDLGDPETREAEIHPRFDQRVFTSHEAAVLSSAAEDRHRLRWSVWAAKESAFKAAKRENPTAIFAHRSFEVMLEPNGWGTVHRGPSRWVVRTTYIGDAIHVICAPSRTDHEEILSAVAVTSPNASPSAAARQLACRHLARHLGIPEHELSVTNNNARIPELYIRGELSMGALSLTHHGRFVAYAYLPTTYHSHGNNLV